MFSLFINKINDKFTHDSEYASDNVKKVHIVDLDMNVLSLTSNVSII